MPQIKLILAIFLLSLSIALGNSDIKIIKSSPDQLIFEWRLTDYNLGEIQIQQELLQQITFFNARNAFAPGQPDIPQREITFGVPQEKAAHISIISSESSTLEQINLAPVFTPQRESSRIDQQVMWRDKNYYQVDASFPTEIMAKPEPGRFRDIYTETLLLRPFQYNPVQKKLTIYTRVRIQVDYNTPKQTRQTFRSRGKLDQLYAQKMINFDQAQHWQIPKNRKLFKSAYLPEGTWYRFAVNEDGLYKITPAILSTAGIDINNLKLQDIQIFNNGGHMLSYTTNATRYNPPFTTEMPALTIDQNKDGVMNSDDYILVYGKGVNGWFYESSTNDFRYQQHPYANTNYFWITISASNGSRMQELQLQDLGASTDISYFMERLHIEQDLYNLLASGPDWYGYRFFGLSDSYALNFDIEPDFSFGKTATAKVRFKGGSGVEYGDDAYYRYEFNVAINNNFIASNKSFTRYNFLQISEENISSLNNGANTLNLYYSGNQEGCLAHLDWFELYYPRNFNAKDNQLTFYAEARTSPQHFTVSALGALNDFYILDVTNPSKPIVLGQDLSSSGGQLSFDLPASSQPQQILVTSLASPGIKTVQNLEAQQRGSDLLSTANQADYLIITHKTFLPYARQMAARRPQLNSKVVTMDEVYFEFNAGVPDPTALRNFIRYAYNEWQSPAPSYVLLFGDGHYDYRNIQVSDTMRVPPFEIFNVSEVNSRSTDNYFVDLEMTSNSFSSIDPDLAIGRIPIESTLDAERYLKKIEQYEDDPNRDGWQTNVTFIADDAERPGTSSEYEHQNQTEDMATMAHLKRFIKQKIYLSTYPSEPGGFGRIKPKAGEALVDAINQGTLIINYVGHGSPAQWAHEGVFVMSRDLSRIYNPGRLPFLIAATCDFGKFDDPEETSFNEALIWLDEVGIIGGLASTRLVYSSQNAAFNKAFYQDLFPIDQPSNSVGAAKLLATGSGINDQKYVLFADPTMHLADPRGQIAFTTNLTDSLKALSEVEISADVMENEQLQNGFEGEAVMIVSDASYDSVSTGSGYNPIILPGPTLFKGRISVTDGQMHGKFIVPKTIRYINKRSGRITLYAWDAAGESALGYNDALLFKGSVADSVDDQGPQMDIYFEDQESFSSGDLIKANPVLIADLQDPKGINITGAAGHTITVQIDQDVPKNISGFFTYQKDSYTRGQIHYPLGNLNSGAHRLMLKAFDNLNNGQTGEIEFNISSSSSLLLEQVVNYPNPFQSNTQFTFQTNRSGSDIRVRIFTISGRLIQELEGISNAGFNNDISWDGRDQDGDLVSNGVYLYQIRLKDGEDTISTIEKLVLTR